MPLVILTAKVIPTVRPNEVTEREIRIYVDVWCKESQELLGPDHSREKESCVQMTREAFMFLQEVLQLDIST